MVPGLSLGLETLDSCVSPGLSRCKPHIVSRSRNTFSSQRTNLHVPFLLALPGFSERHFLLPSHISWRCELGEEPSTSAVSISQTYSLLLSLSSIPTITESSLPNVTSDSPSANVVTFSQSLFCLTSECLTPQAISSLPLWRMHFCFHCPVVFYYFPTSGWDLCSLSWHPSSSSTPLNEKFFS